MITEERKEGERVSVNQREKERERRQEIESMCTYIVTSCHFPSSWITQILHMWVVWHIMYMFKYFPLSHFECVKRENRKLIELECISISYSLFSIHIYSHLHHTIHHLLRKIIILISGWKIYTWFNAMNKYRSHNSNIYIHRYLFDKMASHKYWCQNVILGFRAIVHCLI